MRDLLPGRGRALAAQSLSLLMWAVVATAQTQAAADPGGPVVGALLRYNEDSATLTDKDGKEVFVPMTRGWTVSKARQMTAATLGKGDFVATGNQAIDDHTGKSTEVRIFEPGYERDLGNKAASQAGRIETHGTVSQVSRTSAGVELDVTFPGGSRHLIVPMELPVTRYEPLGREVLKPGTAVRAVLLKEADGIYRAGRLTLQ